MRLNSVAIIQNKIIKGGRLAVLVQIIKILNEMDIIPDIYSLSMTLNSDDISKHYGEQIRFNYIPVKFNIKVPNRWSILYFNKRISLMNLDYDLVINNSNGSRFLPMDLPFMHFIHYPQKDRVLYEKSSIHFPDDTRLKLLTREGFYDAFVRRFYKYENMNREKEIIIANSEFTKLAILRRFDVKDVKINIIYPPIKVPNRKPDIKHKDFKSVVSTGRFSAMKRQIEQIEIGSKLLDYTFNIIGFKEEGSKYFEQCQNLIDKKNIKNVKLYPNISHEKKIDLLNLSGLFIHSTRNEPFGITSAEAIANGCIPIVHNSGGQKEIVTFDSLRYDSNENCIELMENLLRKDLAYFEDLFDVLFHNISKFNEETFRNDMQTVLEKVKLRSI